MCTFFVNMFLAVHALLCASFLRPFYCLLSAIPVIDVIQAKVIQLQCPFSYRCIFQNRNAGGKFSMKIGCMLTSDSRISMHCNILQCSSKVLKVAVHAYIQCYKPLECRNVVY